MTGRPALLSSVFFTSITDFHSFSNQKPAELSIIAHERTSESPLVLSSMYPQETMGFSSLPQIRLTFLFTHRAPILDRSCTRGAASCIAAVFCQECKPS